MMLMPMMPMPTMTLLMMMAKNGYYEEIGILSLEE